MPDWYEIPHWVGGEDSPVYFLEQSTPFHYSCKLFSEPYMIRTEEAKRFISAILFLHKHPKIYAMWLQFFNSLPSKGYYLSGGGLIGIRKDMFFETRQAWLKQYSELIK